MHTVLHILLFSCLPPGGIADDLMTLFCCVCARRHRRTATDVDYDGFRPAASSHGHCCKVGSRSAASWKVGQAPLTESPRTTAPLGGLSATHRHARLRGPLRARPQGLDARRVACGEKCGEKCLLATLSLPTPRPTLSLRRRTQDASEGRLRSAGQAGQRPVAQLETISTCLSKSSSSRGQLGPPC